jgi:hypothetical protein
MELIENKQVRFSKLLEQGGTPGAYLPFGDPEKDNSFMRAVKEERVVTIKQEPASKHKDFGIVGFLKEKYVTYLIFPKSLREFNGHRVIGINYDVLSSENVIPFGGPQPVRTRPKPAKAPPKEKPAPKRKKEKPPPQPKQFSVRLCVTATVEKDIQVTAWNKREAESKARDQAEEAIDLSNASTQTKVIRVRELG